MELRNKEEEMKYFSNFIFKAVFYTEKRLARRLPSVARSVPCLQGDWRPAVFARIPLPSAREQRMRGVRAVQSKQCWGSARPCVDAWCPAKDNMSAKRTTYTS